MYQYKLNFKLEKNFLVKGIDRVIVSFLKAAVQSYSPELFEKLYTKSRSVIKSYCFSYYLPGARFKDDKIELDENGFTLYFSDLDQQELLWFFNAFQAKKHSKYPMASNTMELVSLSVQNINDITDNEVIIKMQSPLVVRRHNSEDNTDIYYSCDMPGFSEALKENVEIFLEKMNLPLTTEGFSMTPVKAKKIVKFIFGRPVDASIGVFKLTGDIQLLNVLHMSGIGVRRSSGNGQFRVIG